MRKGVIIQVRGADDWVQQLLPGFEERAERGAMVVIGKDRILVDRRGENLYDKRQAVPGEGQPKSAR